MPIRLTLTAPVPETGRALTTIEWASLVRTRAMQNRRAWLLFPEKDGTFILRYRTKTQGATYTVEIVGPVPTALGRFDWSRCGPRLSF
jgi:hypothetical protein